MENVIIGNIIVDKLTKQLLKRIKKNEIAVINHQDLDEVVIKDIINAGVKAIINFDIYLSGNYMANKLELLFNNKIPMFTIIDNKNTLFEHLEDGMRVIIKKGRACFFNKKEKKYNFYSIKCREFSFTEYMEIINRVSKKEPKIFNNFINNSIKYLKKEFNLINKLFPMPELNTIIEDRNVVIVVRGKNYREDFYAIYDFIKNLNPIYIGVDGGADLIMESGIIPNVVLGDMDSVSDQSLILANDVIVHAYLNGYAPGLQRVKNLAIPYKILSFFGTSEDIALLLAYEAKARYIFLIGSHNNFADYHDKGRKGMSSTILTRLKVGHKVLDLKGISMLLTHKSLFVNNLGSELIAAEGINNHSSI